MRTNQRTWLASMLIVAMLLSAGSISCSNPDAEETPPTVPLVSDSGTQSFTDMLAKVSSEVGKVGDTREGAAGRRVCVFEEKHTSVLGQIEIALMLLRLHDQYGLKNILLEGLTRGKVFPDTKWFRSIGGPQEEELRNELLVGLLRDGEISAVELIALAFPDVVVHAADGQEDYKVELTKKGSVASTIYLYKIALKSVRPEHYARLEQLNQQQKVSELVEYVISLDSWAKQKYDQSKQARSNSSVEQVLRDLQEIEDRAKTVGAEITTEDRSAMSEARAFFDAAGNRSQTIVDTAVGMDPSVSLMAMNIGAAHTERVKRLLDQAKVTYGVLTPLALAQNLTAGDLGYDAFERKGKKQSVAWTGKGLGSLLDGRKKPPPVAGERWLIRDSQARVALIRITRAFGSPNFPDQNLMKKVDALDQVKVDWGSIKPSKEGGGVLVKMSFPDEKGVEVIWALGKKVPVGERQGHTLEQKLLDERRLVEKEPGERKGPPQDSPPPVEILAPDVVGAFSKDPEALGTVTNK